MSIFACFLTISGCTLEQPPYPEGFGNYKIAIDPGHGGENKGVKSVFNDLEKHYNMMVAWSLRKQLMRSGHFEAVMVRTGDVNLSPAERAEIVSKTKADALVSLHFNGGLESAQSGFAIIWSRTPKYEENLRLAAHTANALIYYGFSPDKKMGPIPEKATPVLPSEKQHNRRYMASARVRGIYEDRTQYIGLLRRGKIPSILIEAGYFSNYIDCTKFHLRWYRDKLVCAIERGLVGYFAETEAARSRDHQSANK